MDLNWALAYYWCALGLSILTIVGQARIIRIIARQLSDLFKYTNDGENSNDDELQLIEFEKKTFLRSSVLRKKKEITFLPSATITQSRVPCVGRPTLAGRQQVISCLHQNNYAQVTLSCRIILGLPIPIFFWCHISSKQENSWSYQSKILILSEMRNTFYKQKLNKYMSHAPLLV